MSQDQSNDLTPEAAGAAPPSDQAADAAGTFAQLLAQEEYRPPRRGEIRTGEVLAIEDNMILVDIGAKRDAIIPPEDIKRVDEEVLQGLDVGDEVPVYVLQPVSPQDNLIVSLSRGLEQQDWVEARQIMEAEEVFEGRVIGQNKGGLLVDFGRLRAFVPNSLITNLRRGLSREALVEAKAKMIGEVLHLRMIEVDRAHRRLVASEKAAQRARQAQLFQELKVGEVRMGTITSLADFGAFVELGGAEGLIHISELDWRHVDHPSDILELGGQVRVTVLAVDAEQGRISLSRKQLLPDPWVDVDQTYKPGQTLTGRVTNVVDFGAFVKLPDGIEGLVHVSQMGPVALSDDPRERIKPGETVQVRVVSVDPDQRRISLALEPQAARDEPAQPAAEES